QSAPARGDGRRTLCPGIRRAHRPGWATRGIAGVTAHAGGSRIAPAHRPGDPGTERVLRRPAPAVHRAPGPNRDGVSAGRLGSTDGNPLRGDAVVRGPGAGGEQIANGVPGGRAGQRTEPDRDHNPVSPGREQGRQFGGLWGRAVAKEVPARAGTEARLEMERRLTFTQY